VARWWGLGTHAHSIMTSRNLTNCHHRWRYNCALILFLPHAAHFIVKQDVGIFNKGPLGLCV
jgi:hypothetical protein